jgi:hypothetical protein
VGRAVGQHALPRLAPGLQVGPGPPSPMLVCWLGLLGQGTVRTPPPLPRPHRQAAQCPRESICTHCANSMQGACRLPAAAACWGGPPPSRQHPFCPCLAAHIWLPMKPCKPGFRVSSLTGAGPGMSWAAGRVRTSIRATGGGDGASAPEHSNFSTKVVVFTSYSRGDESQTLWSDEYASR